MKHELTPKQEEFVNAVLSDDYYYLLFGGGIRGGKSYVSFLTSVLLCKIYPGSRWAIIRKDLPTIKRNVIPKMEEIRPSNFISELNKSTWSYSAKNGSEILLFSESIKDDPELNRFKGLEVNGFFPDEMNELSPKTFDKMIERAGSWTARGGKQPPPYIIGTCNPAHGFVKHLFYDPWSKGTIKPPFYYQPATIFDNPKVPESSLQSAKMLEVINPSHYRRFVLGDWNVSDDPDQLINYEWIKQAQESNEIVEGTQKLGVDVARFGDDSTCFAYVKGNQLISIHEYENLSTDRTAEHVKAFIRDFKISANKIGIDTVGIGAGVFDQVKAAGYNTVSISSGSKALRDQETEFEFNNLRSQMWWNLRELLRKGKICFNSVPQKLIDDLLSIRYKISSDKKIEVESKDSIKKRLGRSTDFGDAVVYAFFVEKMESVSSISIGGELITF
jgi:hypothetical protein